MVNPTRSRLLGHSKSSVTGVSGVWAGVPQEQREAPTGDDRRRLGESDAGVPAQGRLGRAH
jgi:hypothetical protein